jgi:hypothetical protein
MRKAAKNLEPLQTPTHVARRRAAEKERKQQEQYINSLTTREFKNYISQEETAARKGESLNPSVSDDFWHKMMEKHTIDDDFWADVDKINEVDKAHDFAFTHIFAADEV